MSTEQFAQFNKSAFETIQSIALKSIEGLEKLTELNIQATKAQIAESTEGFKALMAVRDPKSLNELAAGGAQPAAEKLSAYAKHVYEITNETGTEIAKIVEKQFAQGKVQFNSAIDAMAKNAPAGSEGVVTLVKSAVSAANNAYDQVNKATKQAVEMAEANLAAATKTPRARKV